MRGAPVPLDHATTETEGAADGISKPHLPAALKKDFIIGPVGRSPETPTRERREREGKRKGTKENRTERETGKVKRRRDVES